jgi:hypothetical protein
MVGRKIAYFSIGISLVLIVLSFTPLAGSPPARMILLGSGLLLLSSNLIVLQIRFFREGDAKKAKSATEPEFPSEYSAPRELKDPRQRMIWSGLEGSRALMNEKEERAKEEERRQEKLRFGLDDEEEILFMGDRSWLSLWPLALLSLLFAAASAMLSGIASLLCLVVGLGGLCVIAAIHRRTRYYITNLRVLVRRRSLVGKRPRWNVIHHSDVHRCSVNRTLTSNSLRLEGKGGAVDIRGLNRYAFEAVSAALRIYACIDHLR